MSEKIRIALIALTVIKNGEYDVMCERSIKRLPENTETGVKL